MWQKILVSIGFSTILRLRTKLVCQKFFWKLLDLRVEHWNEINEKLSERFFYSILAITHQNYYVLPLLESRHALAHKELNERNLEFTNKLLVFCWEDGFKNRGFVEILRSQFFTRDSMLSFGLWDFSKIDNHTFFTFDLFFYLLSLYLQWF